jgi:hypothetical protein
MNHVIAVTNLDDRYKLVKSLRARYALKCLEQPELRVIQDKIHRLLIYENDKIIHTITVVTIPVFCNLEPLEEMAGMDTKFTISALVETIDQIKTRVLNIVNNPSKRKGSTLNAIIDHLTF